MTVFSKLAELLKGEMADFAGAVVDPGELRDFVLALDHNLQPIPRCLISNAIFMQKLDLSDGRLPGGSPLPAIEFHCCNFHEGFSADSAHLERLKLSNCRFVAPQNIISVSCHETEHCNHQVDPLGKKRDIRRPINCISLRHCRIETELRIESLAPVDYDGLHGVLTIDAFAVRVGTNVHISDTVLRAQQGESRGISGGPHYALQLAGATIAGDVRLMPNVALYGGLEMRDAQIAGTFRALDLAVSDGEDCNSRNKLVASGHSPREAFSLVTADIQGSLSLSILPGPASSRLRAVSLMNATILGDLRLEADIYDYLYLNGATVKGDLKLAGEQWFIYGRGLVVNGNLGIECQSMRALYLNGAQIGGNLEVTESDFVDCYLPEARAMAESPELLCYKGWKFAEILFFQNTTSLLLIASFLMPAGSPSSGERQTPILLDGNANRLHKLNEREPRPLSLDTEEEAREYLKLYCASVRSKFGFLAILDVSVEKKNSGWDASAFVRYAGSVIRAKFEISMDGQVRMTSNKVECKNVFDKGKPLRVTHFFRILPGNVKCLKDYQSDFLGKHPVFQAIDPEKQKAEIDVWGKQLKEWEDNLRELDKNSMPLFEGFADLSSASCKQLKDWKRDINVDPLALQSRLNKESYELPWPRHTIMHEFDYRQLPEEDSYPDKVEDKRLKWVRGALPDRESDWSALGKFGLTICFVIFLVLASFTIAQIWPLPPMDRPTDLTSAHLGWRTILAFALLLLSTAFTLCKFFWKPEESKFQAQPFAHLSKVLRERGDDELARQVEAEKMWQEAVSRGQSNGFHWLAKHFVWRPYRVMFRFGLSPARAFLSVIIFWLLGWASIFLLSSNDMLRASVTPVASEVLVGTNNPPERPAETDFLPGVPVGTVVPSEAPGGTNNSKAAGATNNPPAEAGSSSKPGVKVVMEEGTKAVPADFPCKEDIEPALYALQLMTPILNLDQENRCEIRSKPQDQIFHLPLVSKIQPSILFSYGWFWEYAKAVYMLFGTIITSLALLTFSGIARRWEH